MDQCHEKARKLIKENIEILHECANLLIKKEKITREEFEALFDKNRVEQNDTPVIENIQEKDSEE